MKFAKRFLAAACLVLCLASAGWCAAKSQKASAPSGGFPAILQRGSGPNLLGHDALRTGTAFKNFSDICRIDAIIPNATEYASSRVEIYTFAGAEFDYVPWMKAIRLMKFQSSGNSPTDIEYGDIIKKQMPTSLRSQKEWENKQLSYSYDDCLKLCEPYAPLVIEKSFKLINLRGEKCYFPVRFFFFYPGQGKGFYLMKYNIPSDFFPGSSYEEIALYILKAFGDKEGIQDFYKTENKGYFWKNPNRKYAITLGGDQTEVHLGGLSLDVFFIVDEETIFPVNGNTYFSYDEVRKRYDSDVEVAKGNGRKFNMSFEEYFEREIYRYLGLSMGFKKVSH